MALFHLYNLHHNLHCLILLRYIHSGIYITGGSSQIHDLDQLFRDITGIEINTCEEPEECVVRGLLKIVSDAKFKHLAFSMKNKILL